MEKVTLTRLNDMRDSLDNLVRRPHQGRGSSRGSIGVPRLQGRTVEWEGLEGKVCLRGPPHQLTITPISILLNVLNELSSTNTILHS